jgi:hypothetical protein
VGYYAYLWGWGIDHHKSVHRRCEEAWQRNNLSVVNGPKMTFVSLKRARDRKLLRVWLLGPLREQKALPDRRLSAWGYRWARALAGFSHRQRNHVLPDNLG